jgi:hypothetical protein
MPRLESDVCVAQIDEQRRRILSRASSIGQTVWWSLLDAIVDQVAVRCPDDLGAAGYVGLELLDVAVDGLDFVARVEEVVDATECQNKNFPNIALVPFAIDHSNKRNAPHRQWTAQKVQGGLDERRLSSLGLIPVQAVIGRNAALGSSRLSYGSVRGGCGLLLIK